ncbi:helicase-related protein [Campylobacter sp. JMF_06 NA1]|uniref:type I restriction-modification enzyme R subunit C-terminal domain-containing protein n=1 Tax=Campylobacter sp. JMF_06 NA1 TaxID=2983823 RepID=UPI0022E99F8E|nr:type I restriction-modification enzyme R subunit C-terminal domain-containing protein [Campylobacter sp. JMF_06 NA1]MDA3077573.1 helicase-related protein [Campylobacter sp. JMF_06 NA1]
MKYTIKDRFARTIVFCETTEEANLVKFALENENLDLKDKNYVVRITGDDMDGKRYLSDFISSKKKFPVIATTSQLLSTGVDTKLAKVIVLNKIINSMTDFKQIIGRGTRLDEKRNKKYFTVIDFKGSSEKFKDPEFDGTIEIIEVPPVVEIDEPAPSEINGGSSKPIPQPPTTFPPQPTPEPEPEPKSVKRYYINGVEVTIDTQINQIYLNGEVITDNFIDYSKKNIKDSIEFANLEEFLKIWNSSKKKLELLGEFENKGILIEELRSYSQYENMDEFDILLSLAFGKIPLSRSQRAKKANKILENYQGEAREILQILLERYEQNGINELESMEVFSKEPFDDPSFKKLKTAFGDIASYRIAIDSIKSALYAE